MGRKSGNNYPFFFIKSCYCLFLTISQGQTLLRLVLKKKKKLQYFLNVKKISWFNTDNTWSTFLCPFLGIFLTVIGFFFKANYSNSTPHPLSDLLLDFLPSPLQICRTGADKHFMKFQRLNILDL